MITRQHAMPARSTDRVHPGPRRRLGDTPIARDLELRAARGDQIEEDRSRARYCRFLTDPPPRCDPGIPPRRDLPQLIKPLLGRDAFARQLFPAALDPLEIDANGWLVQRQDQARAILEARRADISWTT